MTAPHAETVRATGEDYERAVAVVFDWYPFDVFPALSTTPDGLAASMARRTCLNIITEALRIRDERLEHSDGPADAGRMDA